MPKRPHIPHPGFPDDDGTADADLVAALRAYNAGEIDHGTALEALLGSRLLVPVVAVAGEAEHDAEGNTREKTSDMATVLVTRPDGRRAMLAFTCVSALSAWKHEARPVPVTATSAAQAARQQRADALVVDIAGPARLVVGRGDLAGMAGGWRLTRVAGRSAWIRPAPE